MAVATALAGCEDGRFHFDGEHGKPLSELDLSGPAPHEVALLGPDTVRISPGDKLAITVEGDPDTAKRLRFTLRDGKLAILRKGHFASDHGQVTVNLTMPPPRGLTLAGSGSIFAPGLASDAAVNIAGSGTVETPQLAVETLKVNVAGSGEYRAGGTARRLELTVAGSGSAAMEELKVDSAKVTVAGSGSSRFASDGTVEATILGSGEVRVRGRAQCKVTAMGSGKLVCEPDGPAPQG
ncbi:MAG: DUF2807 domain-containing protein [Novosphingobium sp.]|nr:DUF2807 domain-containing protein [Novosphingobium sp.]